MTAKIQRLRAEIRNDRDAIEERIEQLRELDPGPASDPGDKALAAWALHHVYSAIEAILERVMRTVEGDLPAGPEYHRALLDSAALELDGIRPALLSRQTVEQLHELRSFRHFVRHAYAVELDGRRLEDLRQIAVGFFPDLERELDRLDEWLASISEAISENG